MKRNQQSFTFIATEKGIRNLYILLYSCQNNEITFNSTQANTSYTHCIFIYHHKIIKDLKYFLLSSYPILDFKNTDNLFKHQCIIQADRSYELLIMFCVHSIAHYYSMEK